MKQFLIRLNNGIAWLQVRILNPLLLSILWVLIGIACVLPRLFGVELLAEPRRRAESHWRKHPRVDTSVRGLRRQG